MRAKEAPIEAPVKSVFGFIDEPKLAEPKVPKVEPFVAAPPKKRPPTRSPYELVPEPEPLKPRSPDALGRLLANVLFLAAVVFALAVAAVVFLRPFFFPWMNLP